MFRISLSCLFGAALALTLVAGCGPVTTTAPAGGPVADVLVLEVEEIELVPGTDKDVKVKAGKAESAEAPKEAGLTAKAEGGKVTVSAAKEAKEGTYDVKVKGGKKEATIKVKIKKKEGYDTDSDRRSPAARGDLRSAPVACSGDHATTNRSPC